MKDLYFNGGDGKPIRKGDKVIWKGDSDKKVWIIMDHASGMTIYDSTHPDSDYMTVWAKPENDLSESWSTNWVCRKTKGFIKYDN
jgi:hypothetical protein